MSQRRKLKRAHENRDRILAQAKQDSSGTLVVQDNVAFRKRILELMDRPDYRAVVYRLIDVFQTWRQYNPDVVLEWQDMAGVLVTGSASEDHVRRYLAKNDAAARLLEYADAETGHECSLLQMQLALIGLKWLE